jgi:hypothetical protein
VNNFISKVLANVKIVSMDEITCDKCGWSWLKMEGQIESDCPFCPQDPGGFVFVAP